MTGLDAGLQHVRAQIGAAFGEVPLPPSERLLRSGLNERSRDSYERVRREFAGRSSKDVDGPFLWGSTSETKRVFGYCYFGAPAFQYYLPSAMLACLDDFQESNTHFYSVVGQLLTPSAACLCRSGQDPAFEEQRAWFTAEQNQAVCAFLELVFDHLPIFRWTSARALSWGWAHVGSLGLDKAKAFAHEHRNYTCAPAADGRAEAIAQEICHAFGERPYPGDDQLVLSGCGDEPWEYALEFQGTDWRTLHPRFLAALSSSLCFFSRAGFCYYLPAYMRANLCTPDVVEDVVFHLTHGLTHADTRFWDEHEAPSEAKGSGLREAFAASKKLFDEFRQRTQGINWRARAEEQFGDLKPAERQAIVHYLRYQQGKARGFNRKTITEALECYWSPSSAEV